MMDFSQMELEATLILDYQDVAMQVEVVCAKYLKAAPAGIYVKNRLEPVMLDGQNYYVRTNNTRALITDINTVVDNVYDEENKLVISKTFLRREGPAFVSNEPFIPYRGAKILELLVNQFLEEFVPYDRFKWDYRERILRHFDHFPDTKVVVVESSKSELEIAEPHVERDDPWDDLVCLLDNETWSLISEIKHWLGNKRQNLYHVSFKGGCMTVERFMDWRAYRWVSKQLQEKHEKERDS